jgi:rusticyanin
VNRRRLTVIVTVAAIAVAAVGVAVAVGGGVGGSQAAVSTNTAGRVSYSYYQSMMGRFQGGSMMGGSSGSMMGTTGYRWMMGSTAAPEWMRGRSLPDYMMGSSSDAGEIMGRLFADEPGTRVSSSVAARLGNEIPAGATIDRADHEVSFTGTTAHLVALATPQGGPDETFRIAGMVNPTVTVARGAQVSIELVNTDTRSANGLAVTTARASSWSSWSSMPMMTATPAFTGSALWFLGSSTSAGSHTGTLRFTATTTGSYRYLCPVPGHAANGMTGSLVVTN